MPLAPRRSRTTAALLAILLLSAAPAADVLVVDAAGGPGSDFDQIQPAIHAAADGDVLLVRSGTYSGIRIERRSLTIVADTGATVVLTGDVVIEKLLPWQRVVVAGVTTEAAPTFTDSTQWHVTDNRGVVLVQDGAARLTGSTTLVTGALVDVFDSASTTWVRFEVDGSEHTVGSSIPGLFAGLRSINSSTSLFDCEITAPDSDSIQAPGTSAVLLSGGSFFAAGSTLRAGDGNDFVYNPVFEICSDATDGGHGLELTAPAEVFLLDTELFPGSAGEHVDGIGCDDPGVDGEAIHGDGAVTVLPGAARSFEAGSPVRDGETLVTTHAGEEGDLAFTLFALELDPSPFLREASGPLLLGPLGLIVSEVGTVPAGGTITTELPVAFPFAGAAAEVFAQGLFLGTGGDAWLAGGQGVLVLGPGV